ncbi:MAG: hypothetical protein QM811_15430 [Pirellulales bacterium]
MDSAERDVKLRIRFLDGRFHDVLRDFDQRAERFGVALGHVGRLGRLLIGGLLGFFGHVSSEFDP